MLIKTETLQDLKNALEKHKDDEVVLHYNCSSCDDEQVSERQTGEEHLERFKEDDTMYVSLDCTECSYTQKFLKIENIQGIETV